MKKKNTRRTLYFHVDHCMVCFYIFYFKGQQVFSSTYKLTIFELNSCCSSKSSKVKTVKKGGVFINATSSILTCCYSKNSLFDEKLFSDTVISHLCFIATLKNHTTSSTVFVFLLRLLHGISVAYFTKNGR